MSFVVVIEPKAREDIFRNATWWADEHSLDEALLWYDKVFEQLHSLQDFPEKHPLILENDSFNLDLRQKPVGLGTHKGYRAVYTIGGNIVTVLAVHSASQDTLKQSDLS